MATLAESSVPYGYCYCNCGQKTKLCPRTNASRGAIKGEPQKYLRGHTLRANRHKNFAKQVAARTHHGLRRDGMEDPTYLSWAAMKQRCLNVNHPKYRSYGGRGITICERWLTFENFLSDMGQKPDRSLTIERVDVNGGYELSNCKWATHKEQARNRRSRQQIVEDNLKWFARN
jgi:hypothetical protein